ncbi:peroxiredoxin-6-like [Gracilinanus agilis]|uniref:peroxiredoxin-6-like n=1 Tax=Gracilinanus agilis TaxID=191870 RepID=UPI001CFF3412|nr:peroxiredoxin-6-like [Gracilinanus agilis]
MSGGLLLGDEVPNFQADTTIGRICFHDFLRDSWGILFSHPRDFTPVCTTELGLATKLTPEFAKRNVKMNALSVDSVQDHLAGCKDISACNGEPPVQKLSFPILYPATTGRNFDELLRVIDSLQLTTYKKVVTPVEWKPGNSIVVVPTISEEEAKTLFPKGVFTKELPSGKKYLRYIAQP